MCEDDVTVIIEQTEAFTTIVIDDNCEQVTIIAEALGAQGLSAYDIAVANGFVGTEAEWLDSLKAKNYVRQHDFVSSNTSYCGFAELGTLTSEVGWTISKIVVADVGTTVTTTASGKWDDRLTLNYT